MDILINEYSYIIYPTDDMSNNECKLIIYIPNNSKFKNYIYILKNYYNATITNCCIGDLTKMIELDDINMMSLFIDLFYNKNIHKGPIYQEFLNLYNNQSKNFTNI